MAVFTTLSTQDVRSRLPDFNIGELLSLEPIASGIENTNYFLDTTEGRWVLTVFERLSEEQLPFYLELCAHLRGQGCPVAAPVRTKNGHLFSHIKGKPFSIANRLEGSSIENVTPQECASMGEVLARMHLAAKSFTLFQENLRGPQWWKTTAPIVLPHLAPDVGQILSEEVSHQLAVFSDPDFKTLPVAACHCDLFRNNAMIVGHGTAQERVSGVFDFYFAGCTALLFDVAVTVNDWCTDFNAPDLRLDPNKTEAFLKAYHAVLPFTQTDCRWWPDMLRASALRFWLSRLYDFYLPREASILKPHDPTYFEKILKNRKRETIALVA